MSDNTKQFRWITVIKSSLDWLFQDEELVFVAGDLLWYPVEGNPKYRVAPDAMVVFGRAKGDRGSYKQWEEDNIAPQVVFEILSPGNTEGEMERKLQIHARDLLLADRQRLEVEKQQLEIAKNKRDAKLRELGIDPDTL